MARKADIRLRRSNTANAIPTHSNLSDGEMAMNTMDGALYFKKSDNTIITAHDNTIMHIDSSNNRVGIGTTSPSQALDVNGAIRLAGNGTDNDSHILYFNNGAAAIARDNNDLELHGYNAMVFGVSNTSYPTSTERMRITADGYVGIGTTSPSKPLEVVGDIRSINSGGTQEFQLRSSQVISYGTDFVINAQSASRDVLIKTQNATKMAILDNGDVGIGTDSPGQRLVVVDNNGETTVAIDNATTAIGNHARLDFRHNAITGSQIKSENIEDFTTTLNRTSNLSFHTRNNGTQIEAIRIKEDGHVGIGTTSPDEKLDVAGNIVATEQNPYIKIQAGSTGSPNLRFDQDTTRRAFLRYQNAGQFDIINEYGDVTFWTGTSGSESQKMTVKPSGQVGIGTTSPGQLLDVAGIIQSKSTNPQVRINTSSGTGAGYLVFGDSADDDRGWISYQHASDAMEFRVNASVAMTINSNGYLVFPDGQITSDGTNFIIDGASGKEVIVSSARDVRLIIDDNNDDTNNEFQIFKHNDDSASNKILSLTQAGALTINSAYTFPTSDGSANQVLQTDGSGNLSFATVSSGGGSTDSIADADDDTKIQVEESSDEDIIRFDVAGSQLMQISSNGVGINEQSIDALLHLSHGTLPNIKFERPGTKKYAMGITGTDFVIDGTNDNLSTPAFLVNTDNDVKVSDHLGINITPDSYSSSLSARLVVGGNAVINHNTPLLYLRSNSSGNDSDLRFQVGLKLTDGSAAVRATINNSGHFQVNERLISDAGVPQLILKTSGTETGYIRSSSNVTQVNGTSGVALRHNASTKLNTTSSGVEITGTLTVGTNDLIKEENNNLKIQSGQGVIINIDNNDSGPDIFAVTEGSGGSTLFQVNQNDNSTQVTGALSVGGDATITGNLTVNGTTTTLNTATLDVEDLNITIAKGITTSTGADGAGITIEGPTNNATMTWDHANQYLEFNKDIFSNAHIIGTTGTKVGRIINASGVFNVEAYSTRQISFGNVDNGEHVRIDADGKVGIGTTSPATGLHVNTGATNSVATFESTDTLGRIIIKDNAGEIHLTNVGNDFAVRTSNAGSTKLTVKGDTGNVGIGEASPKSKLQVEEYGIDTTETSTSATTQVAIHTFTATDFRSARFTIQITNSTDSTYHTSEILLVHDGTTAYITEFGEIHTGTAEEATFDADISSGSVRLLATPASTDTMEFKVVCHSVTV